MRSGEFTLGLFLFSVFNSKVNSPLNKTTASTWKERQWRKEELSPLNGLKRPAAPFLIIPCKLWSEWVRGIRRLFYLIFITLLKTFLKILLCSTGLHQTKLCKTGAHNGGRMGKGAPSISLLNEVTNSSIIYVPPEALATFCLKLQLWLLTGYLISSPRSGMLPSM